MFGLKAGGFCIVVLPSQTLDKFCNAPNQRFRTKKGEIVILFLSVVEDAHHDLFEGGYIL